MHGKHKTTKSPKDPTYSSAWSGVSLVPHCKHGCTCPVCEEPLHLEGRGAHYCPVCDDFKRAWRGCPHR